MAPAKTVFRIILAAVLGLAPLAAGSARAEIPLEKGEFDPTPFDQLLEQYVTEDGRVDYAAWKAGGIEDLDAFLDAAGEYDLHSVMGKEPRAAFLINAYNAWAIRQVLDHYPVERVSDIPGFFDKNARKIAGEERTLDGIEADLAGFLPHVPSFAMALSPATVGGPRISRDAFYGRDFDKLLTRSIYRYVHDDHRIWVDHEANALHITPRIQRHMDLYEKLPKGMGEVFADSLPLNDLMVVNFKNPEHVVDPEDDHLNDVAAAPGSQDGDSEKDK